MFLIYVKFSSGEFVTSHVAYPLSQEVIKLHQDQKIFVNPYEIFFVVNLNLKS